MSHAQLARFLRGEIPPAQFPHREHVRMAHQLLARHEFTEAVLHFSAALRSMTARAGRPGAFNQTVTLAFLSLIAQRMDAAPLAGFESFARANEDLFDRALLSRWYRPEQLDSALARRVFLLPDPRG